MGTQNILVVGDWFLDENWLFRKHNGYNSAHTGDIHYISNFNNNEIGTTENKGPAMLSLCGVPKIIHFMRQGLPDFDFIGVGSWHESDTEVFAHLIHGNDCSYSPFRENNWDFKGSKLGVESNGTVYEMKGRRIKFINLGKYGGSTNRIVRVFEKAANDEPHLLYRFDWVNTQEKNNFADPDVSGLENIKAVVVEDHNYGVAEKTIKKLLEKNPGLLELPWYIRSRSESDWLKELTETFKNESKTIRLRIIDHHLAKRIGNRRPTYGKEIGRSSLELLADFSGDYKIKDQQFVANGNSINIPKKNETPLTIKEIKEYVKYKAQIHTQRLAILYDDNTVIAKHDDYCINVEPVGKKQLINIGRTTLFFSSLIAQDIQAGHPENPENPENSSAEAGIFGCQCHNAAAVAYQWSKSITKAWADGDLSFGFKTINPLKLPEQAKKSNSKKFQHNLITYEKAWSAWWDSSNILGLIEGEGSEFQLWRGEGAIEGYLGVGGPKRTKINAMLKSIDEFCNKTHNRSLNCLLIAKPGWGKSFLASSIAKHMNMQYLEYSLSQMATQEDLVDCFDSICSQQNNNQKKLLIFIDEVNCKIEGNTAMGLLLSPIWDGTFIRRGRKYKLSPAVWVFASTDPVETLVGENKGPDFISRINGPIIELDSMNLTAKKSKEITEKMQQVIFNPEKTVDPLVKDIPYFVKTDQVYIGVSFLNSFHGPISKIQRGVLQYFHDMIPVNGVRSIEFFARAFKNIEGQKVTIDNIPEFSDFPELKRHIIPPEDKKKGKKVSWRTMKKEIDIVRTPNEIGKLS